MDAAPVSNDISMDARVRVVVVVFVVVFAVVVVFWRRSATIFSFRESKRSLWFRNLVPPFARCRAETAAFVCICKTRLLVGIVGHCAATRGPFLARWGNTASGPRWTHTCAPRSSDPHECAALSAKRNVTAINRRRWAMFNPRKCVGAFESGG